MATPDSANTTVALRYVRGPDFATTPLSPSPARPSAFEPGPYRKSRYASASLIPQRLA